MSVYLRRAVLHYYQHLSVCLSFTWSWSAPWSPRPRLELDGNFVSREAAHSPVIVKNYPNARADFCDAHELLLMFTSKLHKLLSCINANIFFMMGVADLFAPLLSPHADHARASTQHAPAHRYARQHAQALLFQHLPAHGAALQGDVHARDHKHRAAAAARRLRARRAETCARAESTRSAARARSFMFVFMFMSYVHAHVRVHARAHVHAHVHAHACVRMHARSPRARPRGARRRSARVSRCPHARPRAPHTWPCGVPTTTTPCVVSPHYLHRIPPRSASIRLDPLRSA